MRSGHRKCEARPTTAASRGGEVVRQRLIAGPVYGNHIDATADTGGHYFQILAPYYASSRDCITGLWQPTCTAATKGAL